MRWPIIALLLLSSCNAADNRAWFRQDGLPIAKSLPKFETDLTVCRGEVAKAATLSPDLVWQSNMDAVMQGCMAQRGYVFREPPIGVAVNELR